MQNIGTPRFYVNILEWMDAIGYTSIDNAFKTLPVGSFYQSGASTEEMDFANNFKTNAFVAILGHDCGTVGTGITMDPLPEFTNDIKVNDCFYGTNPNPTYDGFSIMSFVGELSKLYIYFTDGVGTYNAHFGSIIFGTHYSMKNAPNLSLTQSISYGSTKEFTTYNGSSMSNTMWSSTPKWADKGAWELYPASSDFTEDTYNWEYEQHGELSAKQPLSRSGRRSFQLSWSFIDDRDLFGSTQSLLNRSAGRNFYPMTGAVDQYELAVDYIPDFAVGNVFLDNILTHDNFFSQVWHKSLGGNIPIILQIDKDNFNADQFAIVRIKSDTLKATRTAPGLYDISLSLEEAW